MFFFDEIVKFWKSQNWLIFVDFVNDSDDFVTTFDKIVIKIQLFSQNLIFTSFSFIKISCPSCEICVTSSNLFAIV